MKLGWHYVLVWHCSCYLKTPAKAATIEYHKNCESPAGSQPVWNIIRAEMVENDARTSEISSLGSHGRET